MALKTPRWDAADHLTSVLKALGLRLSIARETEKA
jgi:hypothetical protein